MKKEKTPRKVMTPEEKEARAAARAAARLAEKVEQEQRIAKQKAEFEANRDAYWAIMWGKAARIALLMQDDMELADRNSWWFEDFSVNAENESFSLEEMGGRMFKLSKDKLHPSDVERINRSLDMAIGWFFELKEEREAARREAIRLEEIRRVAKAKLSTEELKALGL